MSDDQGKQTPITDLLLRAADRADENELPRTVAVGLFKDATARIIELEIAARAVRDAVSAGGITSHDAPSDAALAALQELAG